MAGTYSVAQPLVTSWFGALGAATALSSSGDEDSRRNCRVVTHEVVVFLEGIASERVSLKT